MAEMDGLLTQILGPLEGRAGYTTRWNGKRRRLPTAPTRPKKAAKDYDRY